MTGPGTSLSTDELRQAVLRSWWDSPTRFTEDTRAERDLLLGAYRDRVFVELAQNAADAAALAGEPGRMRVRVVDGELRVANTGAPLDQRGVEALASLRASGKDGGPGGAGAGSGEEATDSRDLVGRFGVGFAAVLSLTSEPRVVSRTGGVAFSATRTRRVWEADEVPVLRLPWPLPDDEPPVPDGFDTEVRLPLRVDPREVLERIEAEVADVLLVLPWLVEVEVEGRCWARRTDGDEVVLTAPDDGWTRWLTHHGEGCVWAIPVTDEGVPQPLGADVLHAPTPTDERLSLPARLLSTSVPTEPSRRRVLASADSPDVVRALQDAAEAYPGLVRRLPARYRLALVPRPGFPLSDVDGLLRDLVTARLADDAWLPSAVSGELPGRGARVLDVDSPRLVELVADVVPELVAAPLCGREAARTAGAVQARPLGVAELVESLTGIDRAASWWRAVYAELLAAVERAEVDLDELGAVPVPLADGRTVPGARGVLLADDVAGDVAALDVPGLHVVHPDAGHPLLQRLGATSAGPAELLRAPAVVDAVGRSVDNALAGLDVEPLIDAVLSWVSVVGTVRDAELGALALPTESGWRRADESVLPDAAILDVLHPDAVGDDAPLDVLSAEVADRWDRETLVAVGVRDGFVVLGDDELDPADPDSAEPSIPDLDLVADDAWPRAVRLLSAEPDTWRALTAPDGRVRDWLAVNALLAGRPPRQWRLPSAGELAGLFDPVPDAGLSDELLALIGVRSELTVGDADDAELVCARLGDENRTVPPGLVLRAHSALSRLVPDDVEPPERVRTLAGTVCDAFDAVVLDAPWLLALWPLDRLVAAVDFADAPALADVLDLPLATDETTATVDDEGEFVAWTDLPAIVEVADLLGVTVPDGGVVIHEELSVADVAVPWWNDGDLHAADSPDGLARAFAWAADRWADRVFVERLLDDPDPRVALG
ncbi:molecular chaperone Hsp90 [Saccharomonospora sp.]|uniref:sacsin N-terminal ATP-binding-like domain-containing protein n=1 Tax=Saccharomonospora sp. TaxID=33913 RepID=UPI0026067D25|nr:molecular chaperone Hsp90 [Saccharomonospora sp.]